MEESRFRVRTFAAFSLTFWLEREGNRERIMLDFLGNCPSDPCGGKLHAVVCVGYIEAGSYRLKNPPALWHDEEFPLPEGIVCTNCKGEAKLPHTTANAISTSAEEFTKMLKDIRKTSKARWN